MFLKNNIVQFENSDYFRYYKKMLSRDPNDWKQIIQRATRQETDGSFSGWEECQMRIIPSNGATILAEFYAVEFIEYTGLSPDEKRSDTSRFSYEIELEKVQLPKSGEPVPPGAYLEEICWYTLARRAWEDAHRASVKTYENNFMVCTTIPGIYAYEDEEIPQYVNQSIVTRLSRDAECFDVDSYILINSSLLEVISFGRSEIVDANVRINMKHIGQLQFFLPLSCIIEIRAHEISLMQGREYEIIVGKDSFFFPISNIILDGHVWHGIADVNGEKFPVKSKWSNALKWEL